MQSLRLRINSRTQGPIKLHPSKMHNYCKSCFTSQKYAVPANWTIQGRKMQTYVWCRATCNLQLARCCNVLRRLSFMPCLHIFCLCSLSTNCWGSLSLPHLDQVPVQGARCRVVCVFSSCCCCSLSTCCCHAQMHSPDHS